MPAPLRLLPGAISEMFAQVSISGVRSQLCGVIALTMLFLVLQGVQVVASSKRRQVDAHWNRGL